METVLVIRKEKLCLTYQAYQLSLAAPQLWILNFLEVSKEDVPYKIQREYEGVFTPMQVFIL